MRCGRVVGILCFFVRMLGASCGDDSPQPLMGKTGLKLCCWRVPRELKFPLYQRVC
jgi:hypothetical protein